MVLDTKNSKEIRDMCLSGVLLDDVYILFPSISQNEIEKIYKFVDHKLKDPYACFKNMDFYDKNTLVIGERIIHKDFGAGAVDDVEYDSEKIKQFRVVFDSGKVLNFRYPVAFLSKSMKFENELDEIDIEQRVKQSEKYKEYEYKSQTKYYPGYIVIKKEGCFWTCRRESANRIHEILGFKLGKDRFGPVTGCPDLNRIVNGLKRRKINYVVIEDGVTIDKGIFCEDNNSGEQSDSKRFFQR